MYQFFALHALHQGLEKMDGIALAEVEGFLDGGDDVSLHPVRKASVEKHITSTLKFPWLPQQAEPFRCLIRGPSGHSGLGSGSHTRFPARHRGQGEQRLLTLTSLMVS